MLNVIKSLIKKIDNIYWAWKNRCKIDKLSHMECLTFMSFHEWLIGLTCFYEPCKVCKRRQCRNATMKKNMFKATCDYNLQLAKLHAKYKYRNSNEIQDLS